MQSKIGHYQILDDKGNTINIIDPNHKATIWDPNSEFMKELEIHRLRADIKPRKSNMMQAQVGMIQDMCADPAKPQLYIPGKGGTF